MKKLTEIEKLWRDYLYANHDGVYNDVENFMIRISLINDSREALLETMLEDEPNMELVKECKEEIAFQKEQLEDIVKELIEYDSHNNGIFPDKQKEINVIIDDLCREGSIDSFYRIAEEWQSWGERTHRIWYELNECYNGKLYHIHDDLCKLIMEEIYNSLTKERLR